MRKWFLPLTYKPKIPGVLSGEIRQTIRPGRKFSVGDQIAFHGWEGRPYHSRWSFRTEYFTLWSVFPVMIYPHGIRFTYNTEVSLWLDARVVALAELDGIDSTPGLAGIALGDLLNSMHRIPNEGIEAQIIKW